MATQIFLGEPPANIKQWIIQHVTPAGHPETRFTIQGGTVEIANIIGTLDQQWMMDNGYLESNLPPIWIKTITQADIGNTVTSIGISAFEGCNGLTSVVIPDGVTSIEDGAFHICNNLTSVTIPNSVTNIGNSAFEGCISLTTVTIVATGKPGANAETVKNAMIVAGVSESITWNMPS